MKTARCANAVQPAGALVKEVARNTSAVPENYRYRSDVHDEEVARRSPTHARTCYVICTHPENGTLFVPA